MRIASFVVIWSAALCVLPLSHVGIGPRFAPVDAASDGRSPNSEVVLAAAPPVERVFVDSLRTLPTDRHWIVHQSLAVSASVNYHAERDTVDIEVTLVNVGKHTLALSRDIAQQHWSGDCQFTSMLADAIERESAPIRSGTGDHLHLDDPLKLGPGERATMLRTIRVIRDGEQMILGDGSTTFHWSPLHFNTKSIPIQISVPIRSQPVGVHFLRPAPAELPDGAVLWRGVIETYPVFAAIPIQRKG